jgi:hypothetical protein
MLKRAISLVASMHERDCQTCGLDRIESLAALRRFHDEIESELAGRPMDCGGQRAFDHRRVG